MAASATPGAEAVAGGLTAAEGDGAGATGGAPGKSSSESRVLSWKQVAGEIGAENVKNFFDTFGKDLNESARSAKPPDSSGPSAAERSRELLKGHTNDLGFHVIV
ncbi:hypothetical protein LTR37_021410 [Vermiconidia calcicola]|uniref:Uncharacterized protein n=1 Tax=Vermiconidia calcicola TaxID=1690605 RepID=A0ACC3M8U0_9PEZI|nr:hypothetical protein LTR37_021410 [Vermiconidia calcicola]